jgi:CheY-like chemotaxis protein
VLDITLPDMNGFELLTRLRGEEPMHQLPAVFLSGRVEQADIEAGQAMAATYLTKPFVATALLSAIDRAMAAATAAKADRATADDGW